MLGIWWNRIEFSEKMIISFRYKVSGENSGCCSRLINKRELLLDVRKWKGCNMGARQDGCTVFGEAEEGIRDILKCTRYM
jgi:hypothetical protein